MDKGRITYSFTYLRFSLGILPFVFHKDSEANTCYHLWGCLDHRAQNARRQQHTGLLGLVSTEPELLPETVVHSQEVRRGGRRQQGREGRPPSWAEAGGLWLPAAWQYLEAWQDP